MKYLQNKPFNVYMGVNSSEPKCEEKDCEEKIMFQKKNKYYCKKHYEATKLGVGIK